MPHSVTEIFYSVQSDRPRGLIADLFGGQRLAQVLLRGREHSLQPHDEQVADQVRTNVLGPAAHELLRKSRDARADGGFDLSLALHRNLRAAACRLARRRDAERGPASAPAPRAGLAKKKGQAPKQYSRGGGSRVVSRFWPRDEYCRWTTGPNVRNLASWGLLSSGEGVRSRRETRMA